jgi:tight adherence protein C
VGTPSLPLLLALSWAALGATPLVRRARRVRTTARAACLRRARVHTRTLRRLPTRLASLPGVARLARSRLAVGPVTRVVAGLAAHRRAARTDRAITSEIPVTLDLLGVAVGAGCTPFLAVDTAAQWAPPAMAAELAAVVRACDLGASFGRALHDAVTRRPLLAPLADALSTAERTGAPVGPALARLAAEERAALRRRAEAHARRVPVRLLFPLVFLVLPAFVLLTVVPGLAAGLARL